MPEWIYSHAAGGWVPPDLVPTKKTELARGEPGEPTDYPTHWFPELARRDAKAQLAAAVQPVINRLPAEPPTETAEYESWFGELRARRKARKTGLVHR
jgi:hypothetical protein